MLYFFFYSSVISRLVGTQLIVVNGLLSELPAHTAQNGSEITISVYLSRGRAELKHTYIKKTKWLKKKKEFFVFYFLPIKLGTQMLTTNY